MSNPDTTRIFNYPEVTTPASDAKILLDSQTVGSKCIDANLFRCDLIDKTITQRGTFEASEDDADGFKKVVIDIPYTDVHVASGPIATFEGEDLPLKSLTASIVPLQSGTGDPSPTNVRPISGWTEEVITRTGKNLTSFSLDGYWDATDGSFVSNSVWKSTPKFKIEANQFYTSTGYAGTNDYPTGYALFWDANNNYLNYSAMRPTVQAPSNACYMAIYSSAASIGEGQQMTVKGTTATTYEPYAGTTYTIPFTDGQGQSVEVFGGSVDVVNGGEQPNPLKKVVFDGSNDEDWRYYSGNRVTVAVDDFTSPASGVTANIMCDKLKTITKSQQGGTEYVISGSDEGYHQFMVNVGIPDITELRTWLSNNPITVVYELSTPTTFYTQPTSIKSLDGENNVWASTGDVDVEYQTVWVRPTE